VAVTLAPEATFPQFGPLSNVTVCVVESLLVHVAVPPELTVTGLGEKAKFAIVAAVPPLPTPHWIAVAAVEVAPAGGVEPAG
jgi:hypothetical protein